MINNTASTAPTAQSIEQRLRESLQPTLLEVIDESFQHQGHAGANGSGFGSHFRVRITSPIFTGKPSIARHRLVYDALQDFMDQGLHALAIEARPPQLEPPLTLTTPNLLSRKYE